MKKIEYVMINQNFSKIQMKTNNQNRSNKNKFNNKIYITKLNRIQLIIIKNSSYKNNNNNSNNNSKIYNKNNNKHLNHSSNRQHPDRIVINNL